MEVIEPAITEERQVNYGDESILLSLWIFELAAFGCKDENRLFFN